MDAATMTGRLGYPPNPTTARGRNCKNLHQRSNDTGDNCRERRYPAENAAPGKCRGRNGGDFRARKCSAVIVTAPVGHHDNAAAAKHQFARDRLRREEMPAGATCGKDQRTVHSVSSSGMTGRCRVKPSANPMVSATAKSDDPP